MLLKSQTLISVVLGCVAGIGLAALPRHALAQPLDESSIVFEVDTSGAADDHLDEIAQAVENELYRYEMDVVSVVLADDHVVMEMPSEDDLDLAHRLLTRVSARDREPPGALSEDDRAQLARVRQWEATRRRLEQQRRAVEEGLPRDPFRVSRDGDALIVTPLEGDLDFARQEEMKNAVFYLEALVRSAGLSDASRVEIEDRRVRLTSTAGRDALEAMLFERPSFAMRTLTTQTTMVAGGADEAGAVALPRTVTTEHLSDPIVTQENLHAVRALIDSDDRLVALIGLDDAGAKALAEATRNNVGASVVSTIAGERVSRATIREPIEGGRLYLPLDVPLPHAEELVARLRAASPFDGLTRVTERSGAGSEQEPHSDR